MLTILTWIVFGALVGWVASLIMHTDDQQGGLVNIVVGVVGALIGGFVARIFGGEGVTGFNMSSFILSLGGAVILIAIVKLFTRPTV